MATTSDTPTSTFIEAALNVHRNMLGDSKCMHQLQAIDETWSPSPLNSIHKLQILVATAEKSPRMIMGYLHYINDVVRQRKR